MGEGFKFAIGDLVQHRLAEPHVRIARRDIMTRHAEPVPMLVVGRVSDECPGGVQRTYRVRGADLGNLIVFHEEELKPYVEPSGEVTEREVTRR